MRWDPERRPTAQQALKYPYFQIVKQQPQAPQRIPSTTNTITNANHHQNHHVLPNSMQHQTVANNNGRISNVSFASFENVDSVGGASVNETKLKIENSKNLGMVTSNSQNQPQQQIDPHSNHFHQVPQHQLG